MCEEVDVRTFTWFEVSHLIREHIGKRMFEERNEARYNQAQCIRGKSHSQGHSLEK